MIKFFKKLFLVFTIGFLVNNVTQIKTYPHLALKNLFKVLKVDDIGFAHALLHSKWIENIYQYSEGKPYREIEEEKLLPIWKNDPVANLVRTLWFRFSQEHSLEPSQAGVQKILTPEVFGKLINAMYRGEQDYKELIDVWTKLYIERLRDIESNLLRLKKEQKECISVSKEVTRLDKSLKNLEKQYKGAKETYKRQLEQHKLLLDTFQQDPSEDNKKFLGRITKKLKKTQKMIKKFEKEKRSKESERLEHKEKLGSIRDSKVIKKERENINWVLRKIGAYLGVKKINAGSQEVVAATEKKIEEIIGLIKKASDFCNFGKVYVPRTTESILWAFFFHKLGKLQSQDKQIQAVNNCIEQIDEDFKNDVDLEELYSPQVFDFFEEILKRLNIQEQIAEIFAEYDLALHFLISKIAGYFPPKVSQGNFGYECKDGKISQARPNCYETAMHDLFSILWYNPITKRYDDSLFSKKIQNGPGFQRFKEALKYFTLADNKNIKAKHYTSKFGKETFTSLKKLKSLGKIKLQEVKDLSLGDIDISMIDRSVMKQEFMNIVSGKPEIIKYNWEVEGKKIFELVPSVKNFINLCNYFYGTQVETFEDLSKAISTKTRDIRFRALEGDQDAPNKINIMVHDKKNKVNFDIVVDIINGHVSLSVPARDQAACDIIKKDVAKKLLGSVMKDQRHAVIFTLLTSNDLLGCTGLPLPSLNLIYYSLLMKADKVKLNIIEDVLKMYPQDYDNFKEIIHNLIDDFPIDSYLGGKLSRIIVESGFYKKDPFFKWMERRTPNLLLDDLIFCSNNESQALEFYNDLIQEIKDINKGKVIVSAIISGYKKIIELIIQRKEFLVSEAPYLCCFDGLKELLDKGLIDLAMLSLQNPEFGNNYFDQQRLLNGGWRELFELAIKEKLSRVALAIIQHPRLSVLAEAWQTMFELSVEKYPAIVLAIIQHPGFSVGSKGWGYFLQLALEWDLREIALAILNHHKFDGSGIFKSLTLAIEKGYRDIVLTIIKNPKYKIKKNKWEGILELALEREHSQIALDIMEKPGFNSKSAGKSLVLALKNKLEEISLKILSELNAAGWNKTLIFALKQNLQAIAFDLIENPKFNAGNIKIEGALRVAVKDGFEDVALKIIEHSTFNAQARWVKGVLQYFQKLANEKTDRQKIQEIIDTIKQRQSKK